MKATPSRSSGSAIPNDVHADTSGLTHLDANGRARMVDVGGKAPSQRIAVASCVVRTRPDVVERIRDGDIPKGDVLATARVAGIMAAKKTPELIPLCHPLRLNGVEINLELDKECVMVQATVRAHDRTGVEMEALTAVSMAALTIYDMCKALDKSIVIDCMQLEEKHGGKGGSFTRKGVSSGND